MLKTLPTATFIILTILAAILPARASGARTNSLTVTAEKCFVEAPPEVFQLISTNTRMDMIDYYKAGMDRVSANEAGGECMLLGLEPESVTLKAGTDITYQFFVLEGKAKPYIGVIETLSTPGDESMVRFYTSDWTPVDMKKKGMFSAPRLSDWMISDDKATRAEAAETLPFILTSYAYDPSTQTLTVTNNMGSYYHPTDTPEALKQLKHTITYKWDGKKEAFVREKK